MAGSGGKMGEEGSPGRGENLSKKMQNAFGQLQVDQDGGNKGL
jgi:hypothetical protein